MYVYHNIYIYMDHINARRVAFCLRKIQIFVSVRTIASWPSMGSQASHGMASRWRERGQPGDIEEGRRNDLRDRWDDTSIDPIDSIDHDLCRKSTSLVGPVKIIKFPSGLGGARLCKQLMCFLKELNVGSYKPAPDSFHGAFQNIYGGATGPIHCRVPGFHLLLGAPLEIVEKLKDPSSGDQAAETKPGEGTGQTETHRFRFHDFFTSIERIVVEVMGSWRGWIFMKLIWTMSNMVCFPVS